MFTVLSRVLYCVWIVCVLLGSVYSGVVCLLCWFAEQCVSAMFLCCVIVSVL